MWCHLLLHQELGLLGMELSNGIFRLYQARSACVCGVEGPGGARDQNLGGVMHVTLHMLNNLPYSASLQFSAHANWLAPGSAAEGSLGFLLNRQPPEALPSHPQPCLHILEDFWLFSPTAVCADAGVCHAAHAEHVALAHPVHAILGPG